jgi:hypothetical protein
MIKLSHYIYKMAIDNNKHKKQVALIKFLSQVTQELGISEHTYVVGGAVRNFIMDQPIKDLDLVLDSIKAGHDSDWLAEQIAKKIPCESTLTKNKYGVGILNVTGPWILDGENLSGEQIEIANARKESYAGKKGRGKPEKVEPASLEVDNKRREFTLNSLLWDLNSLKEGPTDKHKLSKSEGGHILDISGRGLKDLKNRFLINPDHPIKVYVDDPSRLLRILKFLNKYNLRIPAHYDEEYVERLKKFKESLTEKDLNNIKEALSINDDQLNSMLNLTDPLELIKASAPAIMNSHYNGLVDYLIKDIFKGGDNPILKLKSLGLWEPLLQKVNGEKDFANFFKNVLTSSLSLKISFDMIDNGFNKNYTPLDFIKDNEVLSKVKSNIQGMSDSEAKEYLEAVRASNTIINNDKLQELGIVEKKLGVAKNLAQKEILLRPELFKEKEELTDIIITKLKEMGLTS